jgi:hypothetical protein
MRFVSILSGCGMAVMTAVSAQARCEVEASGSPSDIAAAQAMVQRSEYPTVSGAYASGTCTITKLLHDGGRPCHGEARHVTVRVGGTTYHVIDTMRAGGYCTTW